MSSLTRGCTLVEVDAALELRADLRPQPHRATRSRGSSASTSAPISGNSAVSRITSASGVRSCRTSWGASEGYGAVGVHLRGFAVEPVGSGPDSVGLRAEPEGSWPEPEGSRPEPEGSRASPKGSRASPEGSRPSPEGSRPEPMGSRPEPEGPPTGPKGFRTKPNGARLSTPWALRVRAIPGNAPPPHEPEPARAAVEDDRCRVGHGRHQRDPQVQAAGRDS